MNNPPTASGVFKRSQVSSDLQQCAWNPVMSRASPYTVRMPVWHMSTFTTCSLHIEQCFPCSMNGSPKLYWLFLGSRHSSFRAGSFYRAVETFFDQYRNCTVGNFGSKMAHSWSTARFAKLTMLNNSCCLICMMIPHTRIFCKPSGFTNAWLALNTTLPCYCKGLSTKPAQRELGSYH